MKTCFIFFVFSFFAISIAHAQRYELVWSDEFNGDSLDLSTWTPWIGTAYNNEDQYYTPRDTNVFVADGNLHLVGLRENYEGRNWTSARIKTQGNADFLYGLVEIRAKLPAGKGLWPAFWMMPTNSEYGSWPYSGEMDIMEYRGHQTNRTQGTIHFSKRKYPGSGNANGDRRYMGDEYILEEGSLAEDFYLYKFEWTDSTMSWYLNDVHFQTITKSQVEKEAEVYPFNKEFYVILNLAVGGNYLGDNQPDDTTPDRNEVIIDYVRVYKDVNNSPEITFDFRNEINIAPGEEVTITPTVTDPDGTIESVEFYINGKLVQTDNSAPYTFRWTPTIDGCYPFSVKASDNDGAVTKVSNNVVFDVGTGCEQVPFEENPQPFPGNLEFEKFDLGGNGIGYFDQTPDINTGNDFRKTEAVDIIQDPLDAENYLVNNTEPGEWLRYSIEVVETGIYDFELRAVPDGGTGRVDFLLDDKDWIYFTRLNSENGGNYMYKTREGIPMEAGSYDLKAQILQSGIMLDRLTGILIKETFNETELSSRPRQSTLLKNYPNPFNPSTTISVYLSDPNPISLQVYNNLGKYVETIFEGNLNKGTHRFNFDASNLSSGLYFSQLAIPGEYVQTEKMLLVK